MAAVPSTTSATRTTTFHLFIPTSPRRVAVLPVRKVPPLHFIGEVSAAAKVGGLVGVAPNSGVDAARVSAAAHRASYQFSQYDIFTITVFAG